MQKRSHRSGHSKGKKSSFSLLNLCLLTLFTLLSAYLVFMILTYNILNFRYLNLMLMGALLVIFLVSLILLLAKRMKWFARGLLLISSVLVGLGAYAVKSTVDLANQFNYTASFSQVEMSIIAAADSELSDIADVKTVLQASNDASNAQDLLDNLKEHRELSPTVEEVDSYQTAYETILKDGQKAMVLNSAYLDLLESQDPEFSSKIKTLYTSQVEKEIEVKETAKDEDIFNIYISGIDTYGSISAISRSDVNLIMTVNRKTNKILITTTPRDSYLPIAGGGNNQHDKLTHAGLYGVNASIQTLENLYGIDIDYYARVNFTSFLTLVDLVGGIEVVNDQAFTSIHSDRHYPAGTLQLDGEQALDFVRERYGLEDGDNDRGKNQEKVLAALIKKVSSINSLSAYTSLVNTIGDSVQTNIPLTTLMDIANTQLDSGTKYEIETQALEGTGSTGQLKSYAMPNASLYMVSVDSGSLATVKQAINDTMEGK